MTRPGRRAVRLSGRGAARQIAASCVIALALAAGSAGGASAREVSLELQGTWRFGKTWVPEEAGDLRPSDDRLDAGHLGLGAQWGGIPGGNVGAFVRYEYVPHELAYSYSTVRLSGHIASVGISRSLEPYRSVQGVLEGSVGVVALRGAWLDFDLRGEGVVTDVCLTVEPRAHDRLRVRMFLGYRYSKVRNSRLHAQPLWPSPPIDFGGVIVGLSVGRRWRGGL